MNQAGNGAAGNTLLMHTASNLYMKMAALGWPGSCTTVIKATSEKLASPGNVIRPLFVLSRSLPACRRLLFPLLHAEKGRLRNAVANRVPASCWVPKILGTRCDRLAHSAHCLT